ncbi:MAG: TIGR04283 family arsenosugar biosynthesis glycosyltransferase [Gammaproteobacteria bacterium]|nr:TIGR04283 family arsenosugar biosynthesis glycosyltransferase [Gammaproteobacteria bacterium]
MQFSIIIPTLNESTSLADQLPQLLSGTDDPSRVEIIISDGGSTDDTLEQARRFPLQIVTGDLGRATQMNHGAQQASGDWLLFLHADTRLPADWMNLIEQCSAPWGRFDLQLSGQHWLLRVVETMMNWRSRLTSVATGDQVLFFRRDFFNQLQGFPAIPLMEDVAISKQARKLAKPACIRQPVISSSRRWEQHGILRTISLMWLIRFAYWIGIKPETLHRLYYPSNA